MSYFNHAFTKIFLGTKGNQSSVPGTSVALDQGFITASGISSAALSERGAPYTLGPGTFGMFDSKTYLSLSVADLSSNSCCPLVLASASLLTSDKIGPFHGGYLESNKSKIINPKFVRKAYRVDPCVPQATVVHIGNTNYTQGGAIATVGSIVGGSGYSNATNVATTGGTGSGATVNITVTTGAVTAVTIADAGIGYTVGDVLTISGGGGNATFTITALVDFDNTNCCFEFLCGETYTLRIDIKGSPALRFANHNLYRNFEAYTGCCVNATPDAVDSTLVMINWATQVIQDPYMQSFVKPIVYDETGQAWFATAADAVAAGYPSTQVFENYVSAGHTPGACAGLSLTGAYVDTQFGNCSFQLTDFFEKEPIKVLASLVDYTGDPCVFEGICVITECYGRQGNGFGEQVVRDLIKAESYLQNFFHSDIRIREITQGDQILNSINRNALYYRYYIQHSVPRYNNPSGVFDNDQYLLEIVTTAPSATFETFIDTWLGNCTDCVELETVDCTTCDVTPITPYQP